MTKENVFDQKDFEKQLQLLTSQIKSKGFDLDLLEERSAIYTALIPSDSRNIQLAADDLTTIINAAISLEQDVEPVRLYLVYYKRASLNVSLGNFYQSIKDLQDGLQIAHFALVDPPLDDHYLFYNVSTMYERLAELVRDDENLFYLSPTYEKYADHYMAFANRTH